MREIGMPPSRDASIKVQNRLVLLLRLLQPSKAEMKGRLDPVLRKSASHALQNNNNIVIMCCVVVIVA